MTTNWYLVVIRHKFSRPTEFMTTLQRAIEVAGGQTNIPTHDVSVFDRDGNELTLVQLKGRLAVEE